MRHEFSAAVKRAALARANGRCEATGLRYGLAPGQRCTADLSVTGVQHDHFPLGAHAEGSNTLENDVVCCPRCNQHAANHTDKQVEQKIKNLAYDTAIHDVRSVRKAGVEAPEPEKPRGRQGYHRPVLGRGFAKRTTPTQWAKRPFAKRMT